VVTCRPSGAGQGKSTGQSPTSSPLSCATNFITLYYVCVRSVDDDDDDDDDDDININISNNNDIIY